MKAIYLLIITLIITTGSFKSGLAQATLTLPADTSGCSGQSGNRSSKCKGNK
jgi:hypothetical protein